MKKTRMSKMVDLAAKGLTNYEIIQQLELEVKWALCVFSSEFFRSLVKMKKNESSN